MNNHCAFSQGKECLKWLDYELTRHELEEADDLCHGNWIEIQHLREYIALLQETLRRHGVNVPPEY